MVYPNDIEELKVGLSEGAYQVLGYERTSLCISYILTIQNKQTNEKFRIRSNDLLSSYISSTQIPAGGFEITISKHNESGHDPIVTIKGYGDFVLF